MLFRSDFLGPLLREKKESLEILLQKNKILKWEIGKEEARRITAKNIKGVYTDKVWGRSYPQKNFASHILGFLNQAGEGQYGLEGFYNNILKGEKSFQQASWSPFGYLASFSLKQKKEEIKGANLYLTIDYNIQYAAEKFLSLAKKDWDIDAGQIIVEEPSSGKILALADFPSFNPNDFFKQKNLAMFLNPVIQELFEPGSIFKPITFAAALQEGLITPETTYIDSGSAELGGKPIYNFQRRKWGKQTMTGVLEESINTGAVFVEQKLGKETFLRYLKKFGFFEPTGIDLQGEVFSRNRSLAKGRPRHLATASFGQGIEITPIQIVRAFGAIANGGLLMRPFVVEKIQKSGGKVIRINDIGLHRDVTPQRIIQVSSNVGAAYASDKIGKKAFYQMLRMYGFGKPTGLPLPGETAGILRKPKTWSARSKPTIAMGQEIAVSAVQVVSAATVFANSGVLLKPRIVRKIVSPQGDLIKEYPREPIREVLSPKVAKETLAMMETATENQGTARRARIKGLRISAKTGTAQVLDTETGKYSKNHFISSFLGIFPTDNPELIIYVVIDNPKYETYGGRIAAPVFKKITEFLVTYRGIPLKTDTVYKAPKKIKVDIPGRIKIGSVMPDLTGKSKRYLLPLLKLDDFKVNIIGSGYVAGQQPQPGTKLKKGMRITIILK